MKTISIAIVVLLFVFLIGCNKTPTEPERRIKTPREMTWTADTLPVPQGAIQVLPEDLLVMSPTDIWLAIWVGHGQIMHYDGKEWKMVKEIGGGINSLVQGNSNDIWAGGYIGHQNGNEFTQTAYLGNYNGVSWYDKELSVQSEILDMTKDPDGNIWACGRNGVILKYDKIKWIADTIKVGYLNQYPDASYLLKSVEYYKDKIYVLGSIFDFNRRRNIYYFFSGEINNWKLKDSMVTDSPSSIIKWGYSRLNTSTFGELYSVGLLGIWKFMNNGWTQIYKNDGTIYDISGPSKDYLIAVGDFQQILFYNGSNWENFSNLFPQIDRNFVSRNVWTDGYDTFIIGYTTTRWPMKTIIWHGK